MNKKVIVRFVLLGCLLVSATANAASANSCDRNCLADMITEYVDALVAHDYSKLPLTDEVRYTENSRSANLGEGLWETVTGKGEFRHDYLDTRRQVAAAHLHFYEGENQVLYSVLLHVEDMKIAGIETLVQRITSHQSHAFSQPNWDSQLRP